MARIEATFVAISLDAGTPTLFSELNPPDWLIGGPEGSTTDMRWFWRDRVLTLEVGEYVDTDFQRIIRMF